MKIKPINAVIDALKWSLDYQKRNRRENIKFKNVKSASKDELRLASTEYILKRYKEYKKTLKKKRKKSKINFKYDKRK